MGYRNGALCIVVCDSKILMVKHRRGDNEYYTLPGGGIEDGETPEQAAVRELWEECSVSGKIVKNLGTYHFPHSDVTVHTFYVDIDKQSPVIGASLTEEERQVLLEVRWMALNEICERDRAFLWAAGLFGIAEFFDELLSWSDEISYPGKRTE